MCLCLVSLVNWLLISRLLKLFLNAYLDFKKRLKERFLPVNLEDSKGSEWRESEQRAGRMCWLFLYIIMCLFICFYLFTSFGAICWFWKHFLNLHVNWILIGLNWILIGLNWILIGLNWILIGLNWTVSLKRIKLNCIKHTFAFILWSLKFLHESDWNKSFKHVLVNVLYSLERATTLSKEVFSSCCDGVRVFTQRSWTNVWHQCSSSRFPWEQDAQTNATEEEEEEEAFRWEGRRPPGLYLRITITWINLHRQNPQEYLRN